MDEQNLETKPTVAIQSSEPMPEISVPAKGMGGFMKAIIYLLLIVVLAAVGFFVWNISKTVQVPIQPAQQQTVSVSTAPAPKVVSNITTKDSFGIVVPTPGFPPDLFFEPSAQPTVNQTEYSVDGSQQTATREYHSNDSIYSAYKAAKDNLSKAGWTVIEVIAPSNSSQIQTELKFTATKDIYDATLDFKQGQGPYTVVNIVVKSQVQSK